MIVANLLTKSEKKPFASSASGRVLLVDDDIINLDYITSLVGRHHQVVCARDGKTALQTLAEEQFDLVILDVMMPGMDGLEVLRELRQTYSEADLPVVLFTALQEDVIVVKGLQAGANDYVRKDESPSVILARVNNQIRTKRLSDERRDALNKLQSIETMRAQFTHIASHDLGNLLNNILLAENEIRTRHTDPATSQNLDTITEAGQTMRSIIRNFMDTMNIRTGNVEIHAENTDISQVLMSVLSQYEIAMRQKQLQLDILSVDGVIYADFDRTVQALNNLMSNAIKYSPQGGKITLNVEDHEHGCRITVRDEGQGVPKAERERLFKAHGKTSTRPTGGEESNGLGLWIVKHLTEMQGGKVGACFPDEGGSVFWIELPGAI